MDGWFVFQIGVDLFLFFLLVVLILKNPKKGVSESQMKTMLNESREMLARTERLAKQIDDKLQEATGVIAVQDAMRRKKAASMEKEIAREMPGFQPKPQTIHPPTQRVMDEKKRHIKTLLKQGMSREDISRQLSIPMPEVDLVISMAANRESQ